MPFIDLPASGLTVLSQYITTPYTIPGLVYYLNPDTYNHSEVAWTMNGNKVANAISVHNADRSIDTNRSAAQATDAARPTLNIADSAYGGKNTLSISASQYLDAQGWSNSSSSYTVYYVGEFNGSGTTRYVMDAQTAVSPRTLVYVPTTNKLRGADGTGVQESSAEMQGSHVGCCVIGSSSNLYVNDPANPNQPGGAGSLSPAIPSLRIGAAYTGALGMNGKLACLLIYTGAHTLAQRTAIMNYLSDYYGFNRSLAPYTIGGLVYWLDPDRYNDGSLNWTLNGSKVSNATSRHSWTNVADANKDAVNATDSQRPTLNIADSSYNNYNTLSFDYTATQWLRTGTWSVALPFPSTWYVVGNMTTATSNQMNFAGEGFIVYSKTPSPTAAIWQGSSLSGTTDVRTGRHIICAAFNSTSSAIYVNNATTAEGSGNAGATASMTRLSIGSNGGATPMDGKIATILIYTGLHTQAQRNVIMSYLATKYNISYTP